VALQTIVRRALAALAVLFCVVLPVDALAQSPAPLAPPPPGSWGEQFESLAQWLAQHPASRPCTEHCFVLTRLELAGAADAKMTFALEGAVLADAPVAVPLFGPPAHARVEHVTQNGKPAAVGFEGDHWFVMAPPGRFTVGGTLTIDGDLALTIPGPLDALDAELSHGRVIEGAHLSGLQQTTVHFDRAASATPAAEPPVFQLSRAVRVGREITFEYRLVMRSGTDLGVVRLPLAYGEKVLDVQGSAGWSVQGKDLVLPTAGRSAQMIVTGTMASSYEWWLVESDAEHRVGVNGDASQVDASESPIPRTQPSARLLLVGRGQHVEVGVQSLVASEVLAAVVRSQERTIVLTTRGDVVTDDTLSYENNGIDWLALPPSGRAVFLATDGQAERVMRQSDDPGADVLLPLRVGSHSARLQSVSTATLGTLGGVLSLPVPPNALTTSRSNVTVGLPSEVHPLAALGGDHVWTALCANDGLALAASIVIAVAALRGRWRRAAGAVALAGLWLVSPAAWEGLLGLGVLLLAAWLSARLLTRGMRIAAWGALAVGALVLGASVSRSVSHAGATHVQDELDRANANYVTALPVDLPSSAPAAKSAPAQRAQAEDKKDNGGDYGLGQSIVAGELGSMNARLAVGGLTQGVAPVALTLPGYDRSLTFSRELVTRERPFTPRVVYVTSEGLAPLVAVWLACIGWLSWAYRSSLARIARELRARLARRPDPAPATEVPPAPPPVVA